MSLADNKTKAFDEELPKDVVLTLRILFTFLYGIIIVFALVGNAIVCYLVAHDFKSSVTNMFLFNLSLVDILNVLFCVPITLLTDNWYSYWPFGSFLCKAAPYAMAMSVYLSALTHVTISCDRFVVVMYPLRPRISRTVAIGIVVCIWIFAFLVAVPIPIVSTHNVRNGSPTCEEDWALITGVYNTTNGEPPGMKAGLIYTIIVFFLQYVFPLMILTLTYTVIVIKLWSKKPPGEMDARRDQRIIRSKKKVSADEPVSFEYQITPSEKKDDFYDSEMNSRS